MAGWKCVYQCEIDPFCRAVLAKHWPDVPRHDDVRTLTGAMIREAVDGPIDAMIGGVPCQPASVAGKRKGQDDDRWLWGEWIRLVCEVRPAWIVAENVPGFLSLSDATGVFRDLQGAGFEMWPVVLGADNVGAPQRRKRVWIVAHSARNAREQRAERLRVGESGEPLGNAAMLGRDAKQSCGRPTRSVKAGGSSSERELANPNIIGTSEPEHAISAKPRSNSRPDVGGSGSRQLANPTGRRLGTNGSTQRDAGHVDECGAIELGDSECIGHQNCGSMHAGFSGSSHPDDGTFSGETFGASTLLADANYSRSGQDRRATELRTTGTKQSSGNQRASHAREGIEVACWPARPGQPQHDWEASRIIEREVGSAASRAASRLVRSGNRNALKALGNAIVPQCMFVVAKAISEAESQDFH